MIAEHEYVVRAWRAALERQLLYRTCDRVCVSLCVRSKMYVVAHQSKSKSRDIRSHALWLHDSSTQHRAMRSDSMPAVPASTIGMCLVADYVCCGSPTVSLCVVLLLVVLLFFFCCCCRSHHNYLTALFSRMANEMETWGHEELYIVLWVSRNDGLIDEGRGESVGLCNRIVFISLMTHNMTFLGNEVSCIMFQLSQSVTMIMKCDTSIKRHPNQREYPRNAMNLGQLWQIREGLSQTATILHKFGTIINSFLRMSYCVSSWDEDNQSTVFHSIYIGDIQRHSSLKATRTYAQPWPHPNIITRTTVVCNDSL